MAKDIHVAIGWDSREIDAYEICEHSLVRRSSIPVAVTPLMHNNLRYFGLFDREWRIDKKGQHWDVEDNAPFSTEFSHTRFLVPELARRNKVKGWVIFCDCDFLWLDDIKNLIDELDDDYPVMTVKFSYEPERDVKMDTAGQNFARSAEASRTFCSQTAARKCCDSHRSGKALSLPFGLSNNL